MAILQGHTWDASVTLLASSEYGDLEGNLTTTFDPVSGEATFMALNMTGYGVYYLKFTATSTPADYSLTVNHKLVVMNHAHVGMVKEETYDIEVRTIRFIWQHYRCP
ncbi:hypothetical protein DPMN_079566 [Dreissena polymorpha]|uniref:Uncharacterized protein n=1 Tax=Dreissena polymorpha TaxID=45954 RepID=A0A9D3YTC3_DREPO|nr:hypothetical protein DPMN_079566 [Dreissena polymorpha]